MARLIPISQYSSDEIGIAIYDQGELADPDLNAVTITVVRDAGSVVVVPALTAADRESAGLYKYRVLPTVTTLKGTYTATWEYTLDGQDYTFTSTFVVNDPSPYWDSLNAAQRLMVENVYFKVSDMYDSSLDEGGGGPYLWETPQSSFGYETIARLMVTDAMSYINFAKPKDFNPPFNLGTNVANPFPTGWYGLVERATFYSLLKHLQRSYLEQPLAVGITTARVDRRDYFDRYGYLIAQEKLEMDEQLRMLKRRYLYATRSRAMLVAGGLFPISFLDPARPRWPFVVARF